ncbi:MAG: hypothetical protein U0M42_03240 [Acutalibacteraceae bacterium]|nr:hypothetical protein [Acutalibacteraceae bacterium]
MDDLSQKLSAILSDPESLENLKAMAENIMGETQKPQSKEDSDFIDVASLMNIIGKLKNSSQGENEKLLMALKPHLSEPRQKRVDTAVKILKLLEIAPLLKDSGVLGGIL